ncbi:HepT-like ribonuclease domain-containing protein [Diaminobutyricimonas sp. TR449]|uniref:HepT-like ribonuclease domain-containing protein n=1 Tax=Diaminobutyricimonas sp. TR449 TaxID=2708076 RepID=UPI0014216049|nr:HepT-like ribonuclease domain-containing protein [Diaminobutyricimonas sp. TR449]
MRPESAVLLWDVHTAANRIANFIAGIDGAAYSVDELRRSAVERQVEIIGEALKNLRNVDPTAAQQIPDLTRIVGLRNILAHGYAVVDDSVLWSAASQRVPELLAVVDRLLAD